MGQCMKACANVAEGARKQWRNHCCANNAARATREYRDRMRRFLEQLYHHRMKLLVDDYYTGEIDCRKRLAEIYASPPQEAAAELGHLVRLYSESKALHLKRYEMKAFFDDFFNEYVWLSARLHMELVVRERLLHMQQLAKARSVSEPAQSYEELRKKALKEVDAIMAEGVQEAEMLYHNQGYLINNEWARVCDFERDERLHLKELRMAFVEEHAVGVELTTLSLLGLDVHLERARVHADKLLFGPRKSVVVDVADSPRVPSEGVVLGYAHAGSPHHGLVHIETSGQRPVVVAASAAHSGYASDPVREGSA